MKITPASLSISQLFGTNNEQFFIPAYQRRYAWGWKQLAELFDDIDLLNEADTHLLGTVLFLTDSHKAGINILELVDGQQRITSLCLLFKAIHDQFKELGDDETAKEVEGNLNCRGLDKKQKTKILLGDLDHADFSKVMASEDTDEIINTKLLKAYEWFKEWLSDYDNSRLDVFYFKLINNVMVIRLDVGHAKDAYKLFETINNRGLKLSPTDIIKNFLLGHASLVEGALPTVKEHWKSLIVHLDGIDTDDFFRQFQAGILLRKVTKSTLIDLFKGHYFMTVKEATLLSEYRSIEQANLQAESESEEEDDDDAKTHRPARGNSASNKTSKNQVKMTSFTKSLKDASTVYGQIVNRGFESKKVNQHLFNLQRVKSFPSYIFLLNLFQRKDLDESQQIDILKMIEVFMLRRHICEYRTNEFDDIFAKLLSISDDGIVEKVCDELQSELPSDDEFQTKFAVYNYKGNIIDRAKYVLETIEYKLIKDKGEYTLKSGSDLHLEHIIPQTIDTKKSIKEFGDWITYLGNDAIKKHKNYVNRIGNMTLIAQGLNIAASNNPYAAKRNEYKKSNIRLTKEIGEKYHEFRFNAVNKRSEELAAKAPKIWNLRCVTQS